MKHISVVLPAYNEEEGILLFHEELRTVLASLVDRYTFEVIYVLDRSRDATLDVLRDIARTDSTVTVVHLSRRFGHQLSLVAGIDRSRGDAVVMMDCDRQHPPALLPQLLELHEQGFDVVQTLREYDKRNGLFKRTLSAFFYRLQNALSPIAIDPGAADYRLISLRVADVFRTRMREHNPFLRGLFRWVGYRTATVKFVSPPRLVGTTKYRLQQLVTFSILGITSFSKVPLRIGSLLGILISLISLIYAAVITVDYFVSGSFPPGYASIVVSILFIGGLQLMVLGFVGEYLGSIFDEVKGRPLYLVDEVIPGRPQ